jgi:predicted TIM-barrel fold metal-dependent hydrolase
VPLHYRLVRTVTFDAHMRIGSLGAQYGVSIDAAGLVASMRENGIDAGALHAPDNEAVRDAVDSLPGVYGLAWANPRVPGVVEQTRAYLALPGFVGIKLHPIRDGFHPNDLAVHPLMELAIELDVPVLIHSGHPIFSLPWIIEELVVSFPEAKVILAHMGHGNVVYINASIEVARRNPNVYLETAGMPMHTKIRDAIDVLGETRVLFGSGLPAYHPQVEMGKVRLSGLSDELVERVLDRNARALFLGEEV